MIGCQAQGICWGEEITGPSSPIDLKDEFGRAFLILFALLVCLFHSWDHICLKSKCIVLCNEKFEEELFEETGSAVLYPSSGDQKYVRGLCRAFMESLRCYKTCPNSYQKFYTLQSQLFVALGTMCSDEECVYEQGNCANNGELSCTSPDAYMGTKTTTRNGVKCQSWNDTSPHRPTRKYLSERAETEWGLGEHSECRVADFDSPWCYTSDPNIRWDYCFDSCQGCVSEDLDCAYDGMTACRLPDAYTGPRNTTWRGKPCKLWTEGQEEGGKYRDAVNMAKWGLGEHRECRVADFGAPWCWVEGGRQRWDFCFPACDPARPITQCVEGVEECVWSRRSVCVSPDSYLGDRNRTRSGRSCLGWDSEAVRGWGRGEYWGRGKEGGEWKLNGGHSSCRVADWHAPWCFVDTPAGVQWEACFAECSDEEEN